MMGKKKKRHNIPAATLLRPRMEKLLADERFLDRENDGIRSDLEGLARDVSPELFLKTFLRAYSVGSGEVRSKLDGVVIEWIAKTRYKDTLREMVADQSLGPDLRPQALAWLEAVDIDVAEFKDRPSLLMETYYFDDEEYLRREKSQASISVFWYMDATKSRARALVFLLDYNPPWDGSVKDVLVSPPRSPRQLLKDHLAIWRGSDLGPKVAEPTQVKTVILTALQCNREAEIRLPRDLIKARDEFEKMVLPLPDGQDTPTFTMEDFDFLARHGERPEKIMHFEQTVGRRVRMEDGEEILIVGSDWDGD